MSMLECNSIRKSYGPNRVLDDVSLSIEQGELVTLLGPSGCGKTTLLRAIAGLVTNDQGEIRVAGRDISRIPIHKRNIGMVFQSHALFPHMTVEDNVAFGMKMHGVAKDRIREKVTQSLRLVHLQDFARRRPHELSGGQQQRVAIARAIASDPAVLLLDEPFGALDRKLRETLQIELRKLTKDLGMTAVFVTHDQEEAMILSDRIAVMDGGRIQQFARPGDVFDAPENAFVASFMGFENLFRADSVVAGPDGTVTARCGPDLRFVGRSVPGRQIPTDAAVVAVRGERIVLTVGADEHVQTAGNVLTGRVTDVAYRGAIHVVYVATPLGDVVVKSSAAPPSLRSGDAVRLTWSVEACRILSQS